MKQYLTTDIPEKDVISRIKQLVKEKLTCKTKNEVAYVTGQLVEMNQLRQSSKEVEVFSEDLLIEQVIYVKNNVRTIDEFKDYLKQQGIILLKQSKADPYPLSKTMI